jgi:5'-nucleotidase
LALNQKSAIIRITLLTLARGFLMDAHSKSLKGWFRLALSQSLAIFLALFFGVATTLLAAPNSSPKTLTLTILHTNDIHASYGGYDQDRKICYKAICRNGFGGSLRLQRIIRALKSQYPNAILLDAGDQFQGTLFWRLHKEAPTVAVMNALGYQFFVPGNHEFDNGLENLKRLADKLKAQVLSANLIINEAWLRPKNLAPYALVEIKGQKIGLVGLTTADQDIYSILSSPERPKPFEFINEKTALLANIKELKELGAEIIVALSHAGLPMDRQLAAEVEGLDIIVGGHTHNLLGDNLKDSDGPYPLVEKSPSGQPVLVVTAGSHGRYLGLLTVEFDEKGRPSQWSGQPYPITDQTISKLNAPLANPQLGTYLEALTFPIQNLMSEKVGQIRAEDSGQTLEESHSLCRRQQCRTGDVIATALLNRFPKARIALVNSGGLRASLPIGEVSLADILAVLPFDNYVYTAQITGQELLETLNHSVREGPGHSGKFLQVAGLKVTYLARPNTSGQRNHRGELKTKNDAANPAQGLSPWVKAVSVWSGDKWLPLDLKLSIMWSLLIFWPKAAMVTRP